MNSESRIIAYIAGANLHKAVTDAKWKLHYSHFRSWLRQKFAISTAYLFIGLITKNADLYTNLQLSGYELVFKDITYTSEGKVKGNCDADLVLRATRDVFELNPEAVVLVTSDGDYAPLIRFWKEKKIFCTIVSPSPVHKCSILLKRTGMPIVYLADIKNKLEYRSK